MSRRRATISFVVVSLALVIAFGTPAISQTPKAGGTLNITQREDLPQGFAIHETSTISTVWPHAVPEQPRALRPAEEDGEPGHDHRRAGREVVVAGQLPQPRFLPPQGR